MRSQIFAYSQRAQNESAGAKGIFRHHQSGRIILRRLDRAGDRLGWQILAGEDSVRNDLAVKGVIHQAAGRQAFEDRVLFAPFVLEIEPADDVGEGPFVNQREICGGGVSFREYVGIEKDDRRSPLHMAGELRKRK